MKKKAKLGFFAWLWVIIFFIYVLGRLISLYSLSLVRNIYYSQLTHYLFAGVHIFLILIIALVLTFAIKRNKDFVYFSLLFLGLGLLGDLINFVYSGDLIEILGGVILAGIFIPYILKSSTIKTLFPNPNKIFIQKNKNLLIFIGGIVIIYKYILFIIFWRTFCFL